MISFISQKSLLDHDNFDNKTFLIFPIFHVCKSIEFLPNFWFEIIYLIILFLVSFEKCAYYIKTISKLLLFKVTLLTIFKLLALKIIHLALVIATPKQKKIIAKKDPRRIYFV